MDYRSGDAMTGIIGCGKHSVAIAGTPSTVTADIKLNCNGR